MSKAITYQRNSWQPRIGGTQHTTDGITTMAVKFWCQSQDTEVTGSVQGTMQAFDKVSDAALVASLKAALEQEPKKKAKKRHAAAKKTAKSLVTK